MWGNQNKQHKATHLWLPGKADKKTKKNTISREGTVNVLFTMMEENILSDFLFGSEKILLLSKLSVQTLASFVYLIYTVDLKSIHPC